MLGYDSRIATCIAFSDALALYELVKVLPICLRRLLLKLIASRVVVVHSDLLACVLMGVGGGLQFQLIEVNALSIFSVALAREYGWLYTRIPIKWIHIHSELLLLLGSSLY